MANYTKKAIHGAGIIMIFTFFTAIITYTIRIILARKVSPEDYGLIFAVIAFFGLVGILQNMGLKDSLSKYIAEFRVKKDFKNIKSIIILATIIRIIGGAVIALVFIIFSGFLADNFFHASQAKGIIILYSIMILFGFAHDLFVYLFQGFQNFVMFSLTQFMMYLIILLFIVFSVSTLGIYSYFFGLLAGIILPSFFYFWFFIKKVFPGFISQKYDINKKLLYKLYSFSFFVILTASAGLLMSYLDTVLLTYFRTLREVGLYQAAMPLAQSLIYCSSFLLPVLLPLASELWKKKHLVELRAGIESLYKYVFIFLLPVALLMFSFSITFLGLLFGSDYLSASAVLKILLITNLFYSFFIINSSVLSGIGQPKENAKITYIGLSINVIGNLLLIPLYGILGAALSTLFSVVIMFFISIYKLNNFVSIKIPFLSWFKVCIAGIVFFILTEIIRKISLLGFLSEFFIIISVSFSAYILLLFIMNELSLKEIFLILKRLRS